MKRLGIMFIGAAMLVSSHAQACQLICVTTNTSYTGDLGGIAGADAKCAAEFPGFRFARNRSLLANTIAASASNLRLNQLAGYSSVTNAFLTAAAFTGDAWIGHANINCSGWTSSSSGGGATSAFRSVGSSDPNWQNALCSDALPITCCNM